METTNKLTASQKETILNNPKVKAFNDAFATLENGSRAMGVRMACLVYIADNDGTNTAMGLSSSADFLQKVRGYSKAQAMNLQRVGKFLKGNEQLAVDSNGNSFSLSAIVQILESSDSETQAHKLISDGTVNALTAVKKLKKQIEAINGKAIVADAESKEVDGESTTANNTAPIPDPKDDPKPYNVNIAILAPDGKGGNVTYKSKSGKYALSAIIGPVQSLAKECTAPGAKIVVTIEPIK